MPKDTPVEISGARRGTKPSTALRYLEDRFIITDRPLESTRLDELVDCAFSHAIAERLSHCKDIQ